MNFIIDNYLWFGIAGVILLMALIGFLAEKTNFIVGSGEKNKKPKKRKKETVNEFMDTDEVVEEPVEEETAIESTISQPDEEPMVQENTPVNEEVLDFSNITTSAEPSIASAPLNVNDTWTQPEPVVAAVPQEQAVVTETGEDLSQPFGEPIKVSTTPVVEEPTTTNTVDEDIWKF